MSPTPLLEADHEPRFGGKAVQLGASLRAGLPVPDGFALDVALVDAVATGEPDARRRVIGILRGLADAAVAVRSSAVGEDSTDASFAGQHLTRLGVQGPDDLLDAIAAVHASGRDAAALAYRKRMGIDGPPRIAVVVQRLVHADCAGVLFTRNPLTGADERVIEATWGLGEAVVAGLVDPDRARLARGGTLLDHHVGHKDLAITLAADGSGTRETAVAPARREQACLGPARLAALERLATLVEHAFPDGGAHDIEFAFEGATLHLLQRRAITTGVPR